MEEFSTRHGAGLISRAKPDGRLLTFPSIVPTQHYSKVVVVVDFRHERLADLVIQLEAPSRTLTLRNREGIGGHDGDLSFDVPLDGTEQLNGVWRVRVLDYQKGDGGEIREAKLRFVQEGTFKMVPTFKGMTESQEAIGRACCEGWESVILGVEGKASFEHRVSFSMVPIDGEDGILGQAGPRTFDLETGLPTSSMVQLDSADGAKTERNGTLLPIDRHEVGHGLGLYFMDEIDPNRFGHLYTVSEGRRWFVGENAMREYGKLMGMGPQPVPLEDDYGPGSAGSHLDEEVFDELLMTPLIDLLDPLSIISIGALADHGYIVDYSKAEDAARVAGLRQGAPSEFRRRCLTTRPKKARRKR